MDDCQGEEHELPTVEAVLAGTLALMTGYSQSLLAELHPEHRVLMGRKVGNNLALLAEHPQLSAPFRTVLGGLQRRWAQMAGCTAEAAPVCVRSNCAPLGDGPQLHSASATGSVAGPIVCQAPGRLQ